MSVRIEYGGVAVGAKEDFKVSVSENANFSITSQLEMDGLDFPNYRNPCELYSVVLDGSAKALPSETEGKNMGWCSEQISGADGGFDTPIVAEFNSQSLYSSSGISLTFDQFGGIYPANLAIQWYKDNELLSEKTFAPNSAFYFCSNKVELYNRITITFYALNMPFNRLRLQTINYGILISFDGKDLRSVKITQELNPLSAEVPYNTCDLVIESDRDIEFFFEQSQPMRAYFDEQLKSVTFVSSSRRKSKTMWAVETEDYIGTMGGAYFHGGVYSSRNAFDLMEEIFAVSKVPHQIDDALRTKTVSGYIPYTTCRDALAQVLFAIQAVADTSNVEYVKVFSLNDTNTQKIPLERIVQGQEFSDSQTVTSVEVFAHRYDKTDEEITAYESESGEATPLLITFQEPLHDLNIVNGEIKEHSENHAVITANAGCVLTGKKYKHTTVTKAKNNTNILLYDSQNIVSVQSATLVTEDNVDIILDSCYNYYVNNKTINLKIIDGKHELKNAIYRYGEIKYGEIRYGGRRIDPIVEYDTPTTVGEVVSCETGYLGVLDGRILKQTFSLNGGIIIKDTVIKRT